MSTDPRFDVDINNTMGHEEDDMKSQVLAEALENPSNYYALRREIVKAIRDKVTKDIFVLFKTILYYGCTGVDDTGKYDKSTQIKMTTGKNKDGSFDFVPKLPIGDVIAFSADCADIIEQKCKEAIEHILPHDFKQLAEGRSKSLLKAQTGL